MTQMWSLYLQASLGLLLRLWFGQKSVPASPSSGTAGVIELAVQSFTTLRNKDMKTQKRLLRFLRNKNNKNTGCLSMGCFFTAWARSVSIHSYLYWKWVTGVADHLGWFHEFWAAAAKAMAADSMNLVDYFLFCLFSEHTVTEDVSFFSMEARQTFFTDRLLSLVFPSHVTSQCFNQHRERWSVPTNHRSDTLRHAKR